MKFSEIKMHAQMLRQANVSLEEFNESLRRLRETSFTASGTFVFGQPDGASPLIIEEGFYNLPPPEGASWSFAPSPTKIIEGSITPIEGLTQTTDLPDFPLFGSAVESATNPLEGITSLDDYIVWIAPQLPPPLDTTPLRANLWTLDQIRKAFPDAKSPETAQNWLGASVWRGVTVEVDTSLPDGVIKQGDKVLCNVKKDEE